RLRRPPPGAAGGSPGRPGAYLREHAAGRTEPLSSRATRQPLAAGDALIIETSGGGGHGPPEERAPEAVARDRVDGRTA
ncbi:hydantoinase B/oxoprolinase family protein, partial [Actinomadura logoneensis]